MSNPRQNAPDAAERERAHEALMLRTAGLQWSETPTSRDPATP
ncbi:hypothetical protein [Gordonia sputi]